MMFVRSVEPLAGRPTLRLRLRPTAGFGERCEPGISGSHHIRFAADGLHYRVTTDASLAALLENRPVVLEQPLHFIIGPGRDAAGIARGAGARVPRRHARATGRSGCARSRCRRTGRTR